MKTSRFSTVSPFLLALTLLGCLMSLVLSGCQTQVRESIPGDWVEIPPGSHLVLYRPVQIPLGRARAFLAGAVPRTGEASCMLEVRRVDHDRLQTVAAGRIRITRVQNYLALVSGVEPHPDTEHRFQLAGYDGGNGSQMVRFGYHFWLDDSQDPNLMRLTCLGRLDDPAFTRPPTLSEIQAALGDQARIELARGGSKPER